MIYSTKAYIGDRGTSCEYVMSLLKHSCAAISCDLWKIVRSVVSLVPWWLCFSDRSNIYSNKKETSDFDGTVSFDPAKMLQQK